MKLQLTINIDGTITGNVISEIIPTPTPTPTPVPTITPPRSFGNGSYGNGSIDEQVARLLQWQFDHPEWPNQILIDGNAYGQPGQPPAARYSTLGGRLALEGALAESARAAAISEHQLAAVKDALPTMPPPLSKTDATKLWESVPSTLDPASMSFLLAWQGGTNALADAKAYRTWYYKKYGKQAPPPAPRNPEAAWITDAELAQIIAS